LALLSEIQVAPEGRHGFLMVVMPASGAVIKQISIGEKTLVRIGRPARAV